MPSEAKPDAKLGNSKIQALAKTDTSAVAPIGTTLLPFAATLGFVLFGQTVDEWTWIGAAVIAGSAIYIVRYESQINGWRQTTTVAGPQACA